MDFNVHAVTYTDDNGDEQNAHAYLMKDGNLGVPGGRYGTDTRSCADFACLAFAILVWANADDSVDCLDGVMSSVVNSGDDVAYAIARYGECLGINPYDWMEDHEVRGALALGE